MLSNITQQSCSCADVGNRWQLRPIRIPCNFSHVRGGYWRNSSDVSVRALCSILSGRYSRCARLHVQSCVSHSWGRFEAQNGFIVNENRQDFRDRECPATYCIQNRLMHCFIQLNLEGYCELFSHTLNIRGCVRDIATSQCLVLLYMASDKSSQPSLRRGFDSFPSVTTWSQAFKALEGNTSCSNKTAKLVQLSQKNSCMSMWSI